MNKRDLAIQKIEAWARWECGRTPDKIPGMGIQRSPSYMPADQADHITVEWALKEFGAAESLRSLLLHVYGDEMFPDSFRPFQPLTPEQRSSVKAFLRGYGWGPEAFSSATLRRFVNFLGRRLCGMEARV